MAERNLYLMESFFREYTLYSDNMLKDLVTNIGASVHGYTGCKVILASRPITELK